MHGFHGLFEYRYGLCRFRTINRGVRTSSKGGEHQKLVSDRSACGVCSPRRKCTGIGTTALRRSRCFVSGRRRSTSSDSSDADDSPTALPAWMMRSIKKGTSVGKRGLVAVALKSKLTARLKIRIVYVWKKLSRERMDQIIHFRSRMFLLHAAHDRQPWMHVSCYRV